MSALKSPIAFRDKRTQKQTQTSQAGPAYHTDSIFTYQFNNDQGKTKKINV